MNALYVIGFLMFALGIVLCVVGALIMVLRSMRAASGQVRGGGVILVGPVPIVFGTGRDAAKWAVLAIFLTVAMVALMVLLPLVVSWP